MTRSERLWNKGHKFEYEYGVGRIVDYKEMNSTPCFYAGTALCIVNGKDQYVDIYYLETYGHENEVIGVIS